MARRAVEIGALAASRITVPGLHFVGGVPGLSLQVLPTGGRSWVLRMTIGKKRRDMGLGGFPGVTLAEAREAARAARAKVRQGIDPIDEARANVSQLKANQAAALTFKECALRYIDAQEATWKNKKSPSQWRNTLETYAYPEMGELLVRDVDLTHVLAALEPIWKTKTPTASRLRGRIEKVLDWATVRKYRHGLNPARWKAHLDTLLPSPKKITKVKHHAALPVADIGAFMVRLRKLDSTSVRALEFAILTAARSEEVRGAPWSEFDLKAKLWVIPAERMKMKREHRVPLSDAALAVLLKQKAANDEALLTDGGQQARKRDPFVFPTVNGGKLSNMAMVMALRGLSVDAVPHGFRSTFRDWASERTNFPREAAEMALAHVVENQVEAAYRRGDLLGKRTRMMAAWAKFCAVVETKGEVIPINRANRG